MNKLEKWVDVRKKQIREAIDTDITIKKLDNLNCYFTIKEINEIDEKSEIIREKGYRKVDKNFKMLEYTPIDKNYNVRIFVDDKDNIFHYYLDITDGMEVRNGVPYYNDMFLDVIYNNDKKFLEKISRNKEELYIVDQEELQEALDGNIITKEQFENAYITANNLVREIKNGTNVFINRGLKDYFDIRELRKK